MTVTFPPDYVFAASAEFVAGQVFQANVKAAAAVPRAILAPGYLGEFQQTAIQKGSRKMESEHGKAWLQQDYKVYGAACRRLQERPEIAPAHMRGCDPCGRGGALR
jgi:hypothetical protein